MSKQYPIGKPMKVWFDKPADDSDYDWERMSFPMGNGHMGVNLFGRVATERLQITENSLVTHPSQYIKWHWSCGLENFAEVYIDFPHAFHQVTGYSRQLTMNTGIATVEYDFDGVHYKRETFGSYPDAVWAMRLTADQPGALNFTLRPVSPHNRDWLMEEGDERGKQGKCVADGDLITQSGESEWYHVQFEGQYKVLLEGPGTIAAANDDNGENGTITVADATAAVIFISVGTNYQLTSEVFTRPDREKLAGYPHPHDKVTARMAAAVAKGYDSVKGSHLNDWCGYFGRVDFDLGGTIPTVPNDVLMQQYKSGENKNNYLLELVYQMGRYTMLCSSREGCLPAHLQGIWNCYEIPPWTAGYWYNINMQMNYWPVFSSNLAEMFKSYEQFNKVRIPQMQQFATDVVKQALPENHTEGQGMDGWIVGTPNSPYYVGMPGGHSGPGTGGLTSKAYWDYYDYTRDPQILREAVYPMLEGMARFYTKYAKKQPDGKYLCKISFSPEQHHRGKVFQTKGCAFDQQMMYENNKDFLEAARLLGDDPIVDKALVALVQEQIDHYDPVIVGYSGQVKEFREEEYYGDIGEKGHRHISHMVGVAPGTQINSNTPAWLDAAGMSMDGRGDTYVGWGNVHRMMAWARIGNGAKCGYIADIVTNNNVFPNLLSGHNPNDCFQVDGVFGITAAMAEVILQSHEGYLSLLPALPPNWKSGCVKGIAARGNMSVDLTWKDNRLTQAVVHPGLDGVCRVKYPTITAATVTDDRGSTIPVTVECDDIIAFPVVAGQVYTLSGIPGYEVVDAPANLQVDESDPAAIQLHWEAPEAGATYTVLRALGSEPTYTTLVEGLNACAFTDTTKGDGQATYKVVATVPGKVKSRGALFTVLPAGVERRDIVFGAGAGKPAFW